MNTNQSGAHPVVRALAKDLSQQDVAFVNGGTGELGGRLANGPVLGGGKYHTMAISVRQGPINGKQLLPGFDGDGME